MNANETIPLLLALQHYESPDLLELCRLSVLNEYLKIHGKRKTFAYLQRLYELEGKANLRLSIRMLLLLMALTGLLGSSFYRLLARSSLRLCSTIFGAFRQVSR